MPTSLRALLSHTEATYGKDSDIYKAVESVAELAKLENGTSLSLSGLIIPLRAVASGILVRSTVGLWKTVARALDKDWSRAYEIPAAKWEEIIAGAFDAAGFDEVVLTPRSGDHGRDVIAVKNGAGSIKIIGSVKAYKPGNNVRYDDVRSLLGVLGGERDASKGIITTTTDFPPKIASDPFIAPFLPTRLELMNGEKLQAWLAMLSDKK